MEVVDVVFNEILLVLFCVICVKVDVVYVGSILGEDYVFINNGVDLALVAEKLTILIRFNVVCLEGDLDLLFLFFILLIRIWTQFSVKPTRAPSSFALYPPTA